MLTSEETKRYARHLVLKGIGGQGQQKLKAARLLVIGAGGLGSPVIAYLAGAGVGQIGVVISSKVDEEFGEVRIRDKTGHDLRVICKLNKGNKNAPVEHSRVVVVDYEKGDLLVEPLEIDDEDEQGSDKGKRAV